MQCGQIVSKERKKKELNNFDAELPQYETLTYVCI
jgi:hypothetical protein